MFRKKSKILFFENQNNTEKCIIIKENLNCVTLKGYIVEFYFNNSNFVSKRVFDTDENALKFFEVLKKELNY